MTDKDIMPLSFFKYKGIFTGQQGVMRYLIKKSDKVTDYTACLLYTSDAADE